MTLRPLSREQLVERQWWPNLVAYDSDTNTAEISLRRSPGVDYALSCKAFRDLCAAVRSGRLTAAFVVIEGRRTSVLELEEQLDKRVPQQGRLGPFWWVEDEVPF